MSVDILQSTLIFMDYLTTLFSGFPAIKAFRFASIIAINRSRDAVVAQAICGVIKQFFAVNNGLSGFGGSVDNTSTPAA